MLLLYALSLMAKPMLVTLPFLLLLLDYWPLRRFVGETVSTGREVKGKEFPPARTPQALIYEKWPLFALAAASCVVTFLVQLHGAAVKDLKVFSWSIGSRTRLFPSFRYLEKMVSFDRLAIFYPYPAAWPAWQVIAITAAVLFLAVVVAAGGFGLIPG